MTVTALHTPDRRPAPLPLPTAAEVLALQAVHEYPAISVLCSTDTAPAMSTVAVARLEQLVDDATRRLRLGVRRPRCRIAGATTSGTSSTTSRSDRPVPRWPCTSAAGTSRRGACPNPSWTGRSWTRPSPPATWSARCTARPRHVVLVLTEREARLFDGAGDTLLPPFGGPFPLDRPHPPQAHPHRRRARQGRRPGPASRDVPAHRRPGPGHLPQPPPRPPRPGRRQPDPDPLHPDLPQPRAPGRNGAGQPRPHPTADPGPAHPTRDRGLPALPRERGPDPAGQAQQGGRRRHRHARGLARRPCRTTRRCSPSKKACSTPPGSAATATSSHPPTTSNTPTSSTTPSTKSSRPSCAEAAGSHSSRTAHCPPRTGSPSPCALDRRHGVSRHHQPPSGQVLVDHRWRGPSCLQ